MAGPDLSLAGWARKVTDRPVIAVGGVGLTVDKARQTFSARTMTDLRRSTGALAERFAKEFDRSLSAEATSPIRRVRRSTVATISSASSSPPDLGDIAEEAAASTKGVRRR